MFDATASETGFKDDTDGTDINIDINDVPDYTYDLNGNMISDANKGISNIIYNHLNLPVEIVFQTGKINYLYNALGQKVKKIVTEGTIVTNTDYLGGFQYKNAVLQFFPHAEGYVNATENFTLGAGTNYTFHYVYNFTDHLGNIRLSYSKDPTTNVLKIIEENHYYPFGLKHSGYNSDRMMYSKEGSVLKIKPVPSLFKTSYDKKFNGKSWETDLSLNIYDFDARGYMPDIVRTFQQDPLAEMFYDLSPQSFLNNNPLYFIDPTGMGTEDHYTIDKKGYIKLVKKEEGADVLHTKDNWNKGVTDKGVTVTDKKVLPSLAIDKSKSKTGDNNYASSKNNNELRSLFEFAAKNSDVEWAFNIYKSGSEIGTSHDSNYVQLGYDSVFSVLDLVEDNHSHPSKTPNAIDDKASGLGDKEMRESVKRGNTQGSNYGDIARAQGIYNTLIEAGKIKTSDGYKGAPKFYVYRPLTNGAYYFQYTPWSKRIGKK